MAKYRNWGIAVALLALLAFVVRGDFVITGGQLSSFGSGSASSSSLNTSLVSYWKLDESSGTRYDSEPTGTPQDLQDNGTVTGAGALGPSSSSSQFTAANNEYLSAVDSEDLKTGDFSYSFNLWLYADTFPSGGSTILAKGKWSGGQREYVLWHTGTGNRFQFYLMNNGSHTGAAIVTADNFGALNTATPYMLTVIYDAVGNQVSIAVNDGTPNTVSTSSTTPIGTTNLFTIGFESFASSTLDWNGRIAAVGFWKKALTSNEVAELYNSGAGKTCCPF